MLRGLNQFQMQNVKKKNQYQNVFEKVLLWVELKLIMQVESKFQSEETRDLSLSFKSRSAFGKSVIAMIQILPRNN